MLKFDCYCGSAGSWGFKEMMRLLMEINAFTSGVGTFLREKSVIRQGCLSCFAFLYAASCISTFYLELKQHEVLTSAMILGFPASGTKSQNKLIFPL
jgi:hypothetical protein